MYANKNENETITFDNVHNFNHYFCVRPQWKCIWASMIGMQFWMDQLMQNKMDRMLPMTARMTLAPIRRIICHSKLLPHSLLGGWCVSRLLFSLFSLHFIFLYGSICVRVCVRWTTSHNTNYWLSKISDPFTTPNQNHILFYEPVQFIPLLMNKHISCDHYNMNPVINKRPCTYFLLRVHPSQRAYSYINVRVFLCVCSMVRWQTDRIKTSELIVWIWWLHCTRTHVSFNPFNNKWVNMPVSWWWWCRRRWRCQGKCYMKG